MLRAIENLEARLRKKVSSLAAKLERDRRGLEEHLTE